MFKFLFYFLWEWVVGKDVRFETAVRLHKKRIVMLVVLTFSLMANYYFYKRLTEFSVKYQDIKERERVCKAEAVFNRQKIDFLTDELSEERTTRSLLIQKFNDYNDVTGKGK